MLHPLKKSSKHILIKNNNTSHNDKIIANRDFNKVFLAIL